MNQPMHDTLSLGDDLRVEEIKEPISPMKLISDLPLDKDTATFISSSREIISDIINFRDSRLLVITGPCSIHNTNEAIEYAKRLVEIKKENPNLFIVMRTYFEKPRTTVGWKGLTNDPDLDGTFNIDAGLYLARKVLLEINKMGISTALEFLDTISPQYFADLISWGAIGARTTESQEHRKLASGLSMPVGFKNGTTGDINVAIDAILAAKSGHVFLSVNKKGRGAIVKTSGNEDGYLILRGGSNGPNYKEEYIIDASINIEKAGINTGIIVDCSHANSEKDHKRQSIVAHDISKQIIAGDKNIVGVMIESNLHEGSQSFTPGKDNKADLKPGVSITDKCVDFETNKKILSSLNEANRQRTEKKHVN